MNAIEQIYTPPEAAILWGINKQRIVNACNGQFVFRRENLFINGIEARLSSNEGIWLITRAGLTRRFGNPLVAFEDPTDTTGAALSEVVTITEASKLVQRSKTLLTVACTGRPNGKAKPRFVYPEWKRSGTTLLITRTALKRVFPTLYIQQEN